MSDWTLFSNHGHVLVCLARDPDARLRDVAMAVGITERAVQKIVRDLQQAGMLTVSKQGRRNQYRIHRKVGLRHPLESENNIGGLIDFVGGVDKSTLSAKRQVIEKKPIEAEKKVTKPEKEVAEEKPASKPPGKIESTEKQAKEKNASEKKVTQKKATEKPEPKPKSGIEKQQGSLF